MRLRENTALVTHGQVMGEGRCIPAPVTGSRSSRIDEFDAGFFGISSCEAAWLAPQQRLLLDLFWKFMESVGVLSSTMAGSDCAVEVGISGLDYGMLRLDDLFSLTAHMMTGSTMSITANRLSYIYELHGPFMAMV
ncbi:hypothetical protein LQZ44_16040 [Alcaligenes nematophilus]|uniref:beta-ketoacyl synthase N-terminal-like domain-containing protein n=1 Tax=Alcaligenes nematophilus TaxID=2994643 RepID=UPI0035B50757